VHSVVKLKQKDAETADADYKNRRVRFMDSGMKKCAAGIFCLAAWLFTQGSTAMSAPVVQSVYQAFNMLESGELLVSAFLLVLINGIRAIFLYNGWFLLCEGISEKTQKEYAEIFLPSVLIPLSYWAASTFANRPHFGVPAFFTLTSVAMLQAMCRDVGHYSYKLLIRSCLIFSIQWLDLIPFLTPYGFGWGELSRAIKDLSSISGSEYILNAFSGVCFIWFFGTAALLAALFINYEKTIRQMEQIRRKDAEVERLRREQLEARLYQELHYLVHDLKRPLTAILGLSDLLGMSRDPTVVRYGSTITKAAEQMDLMISEIKSPAAARVVTVKELLDYTLAQVRPLAWGKPVCLHSSDDADKMRISVNLIRISRALVNLLDNAHRAAANAEHPEIILGAEKEGSAVHIFVEDNGPGFIKPQNGELSGWGSSGQGLAFVKSAVTANGGTFSLAPGSSGGLRCELTFTEVRPL
jgi:signal transduction histidine kinase